VESGFGKEGSRGDHEGKPREPDKKYRGEAKGVGVGLFGEFFLVVEKRRSQGRRAESTASSR
jgi:hypothetical protein